MCPNDYVAEILGFKIMVFMFRVSSLIVHARKFTFFNNVIIQLILSSLRMELSVGDFGLLSNSLIF